MEIVSDGNHKEGNVSGRDDFSYRRLIVLLGHFWLSKAAKKAWFILSVLMAFTLANVYLLVALNKWNQRFFDALQNLDANAFYYQLGVFFLIASAYAGLTTLSQYGQSLIQVEWRRELTLRLMEKWLLQRSFLNWKDQDFKLHDNPEQRISEDCQQFAQETLDLFFGFFREVITLISFLAILIHISGSYKFSQIMGYEIQIHSYLVWVGIFYALIATAVTHRFGFRLVGLNYFLQKIEADFRYLLIRIRENRRAISELGGERAESFYLKSKLDEILSFQIEQAKAKRSVEFVRNGNFQISYIFPFVVAAPRLFLKEISLGQLFQIASAFSQVQGSWSIFIDKYAQLARWKSIAQRLYDFESKLQCRSLTDSDAILPAGQNSFSAEKLPLESKRGQRLCIHQDQNAQPFLKVEDLVLLNEEGFALNQPVSFVLSRGETLLVKGPPGVGKSTMLRTILGLSTNFIGRIETVSGVTAVPQEIYFNQASLLENITYPNINSDAELSSNVRSEIAEMMVELGLNDFIPRLNETHRSMPSVSQGEAQLLAIIRAVLKSPQILLLDEATSSLDQDRQQRVYEFLMKRKSSMVILSIAHREELEAFHDRVINFSYANK